VRNLTTVLKIAPAFLLAGTMMHAQVQDSTEREKQIEEIVLIGYGSKKKSDLTGSVTAVSEKDFNKGAIVSADQLIQGKAPGVRITNSGGSPDSAPNIRIRGGSSLSANNNPLIVIDGIPLDSTNPAGISNPMLLVNPNDIESFSVLKDASATAIYGARASNGVILITTKKGSSRTRFNFSSNVSFGEVTKFIDVMDADQFVTFVKDYFPNNAWSLGVGGSSTMPTVAGKLYDTNWQEQIYRTSVSSDNNFSASGSLFGKLPTRFSFGYNKAEGVVKNDDLQRFSAALRFNPTFFDNHLKVDLNLKGFRIDKNVVDGSGAIGSALTMNPTYPVFYDYVQDPMLNNTYFGGYFQNVIFNPTTSNYSFAGANNPLATLEQRRRPENTNQFLGNIELDYKFHFLPELRAVVNLGLDRSETKIKEVYEDFARNSIGSSSGVTTFNGFVYNPGVSYAETQNKKNRLMDAYLVYQKSFGKVLSNFLIQGGYSWQDFRNEGNKDLYTINQTTGVREPLIDTNNPTNGYFTNVNLQSFFGRTNIDLFDKYLLTFSMRADASSVFQGFEKQWGYFPSAALAWKIHQEELFNLGSTFKELKLRLGWGQTGQQDIVSIVGAFPSRPLFSIGNPNSQYLSGLNIYSALPFNLDLGWETTTTKNIGLDFATRNNLLSGTVEFYDRETKDLLLQVSSPPGQSLTNAFLDNVGKIGNKGVEMNLNVNPVRSEKIDWNVFGNFGYNKGEVIDLNEVTEINAGGNLPVGTGVQIARHVVGLQPMMAWVFEQAYDTNGEPLAGVFVDRNNDGLLNNDDRYNEQLTPNWTYGFGSSLIAGNWDFTANFRGQIGGKVYNGSKVALGFVQNALPQNALSLNNVIDFYDGVSSFNLVSPTDDMYFSDYYLEDASFLRLDNFTVGYKINNVFKSNSAIRFYGSVNNAFIITKYKGVDPENFGGIDSNFYPRPRIYTFGLNLDF